MREEFSWEKYPKLTMCERLRIEYCEDNLLYIDCKSYECVRELLILDGQYSVEDVYSDEEMWE